MFASSTLRIALGAALLNVSVLLVPLTGWAEPLRVLATTSIIADSTAKIAGDRAVVESLMGEGVDPHLYKASPGDVRRLSQADLVLHNGLHLEGKIADILEKLSKRRPVVAVTDKIETSKLRPLGLFGKDTTTYDPHVWFNVSLWSDVTHRIQEALSEARPEFAREFGARAAAYREELTRLDRWTHEQIASIPTERRLLITAHDAFGYFGSAYGIEVLAIQGISTDSEASLQDINHLVNLIATRKVPAVFVESSVSRKTVRALVEGATSHGHFVTIGGELYSDALGGEGTAGGTYLGMVRHNVDTIVKALKGKS